MEDKSTLKEDTSLSVKIDSDYLENLDRFLRKNFKKVLYSLSADKHSDGGKKELKDFFQYIEEIKNEKINNIRVYAYNKYDPSSYNEENLELSFFAKRRLLPNISYEYQDGHKNEDIGFLRKLDDYLKENKFSYAFLFDDNIIPFTAKYSLNILVQFSLAFGLAYLFIKQVYNLEFLLVFLWFIYVIRLIHNYFFPRLVFVLTKIERRIYDRYCLMKKVLFWLFGGLFFTALGIIIERYLL